MLVSICIPTYNRLDLLIKSLEACIEQSYPNIEICISQDCLKEGGVHEGIKEYCSIMAEIHSNVNYSSCDTNLGLAGNWKKLVKIAKGEYVIIIGDDDLLDVDFVQILASKVDRKKYDVLFSNQFFIDESGKVLEELTRENNIKYGRSTLEEGEIKKPIELVFNNSIPISAALIKKKWLEKFTFDETLNTPELEVFLKIALNDGSFYFVNEQLCHYRIHQQSATSSGLMIHRFVNNLILIDVGKGNETFKKKFLNRLVVVGANKAIKYGEKQIAWNLIKSKYYPNKRVFMRVVQVILLCLPIPLIKFISR
ncbi:MAG: glycosyltransferase family 2 protein [Spirosomataceae bacterium]